MAVVFEQFPLRRNARRLHVHWGWWMQRSTSALMTTGLTAATLCTARRAQLCGSQEIRQTVETAQRHLTSQQACYANPSVNSWSLNNGPRPKLIGAVRTANWAATMKYRGHLPAPRQLQQIPQQRPKGLAAANMRLLQSATIALRTTLRT